MNKTSKWYYLVFGFLFLFGLLTIKEGGSVLFFDGEARQQAGHFVPFVLWFNFSMGFLYVLAAVSGFLNYQWSAKLALLIAAANILVLFAFFVHVFTGGLYEKRTVIAMTLRTSIWIAAALFYRKLFHQLKLEA